MVDTIELMREGKNKLEQFGKLEIAE